MNTLYLKGFVFSFKKNDKNNMGHLTISHTTSYKDKEGKWVNNKDYYTFASFKPKQIEYLKSLKQGDMVLVQGRLSKSKGTFEIKNEKKEYSVFPQVLLNLISIEKLISIDKVKSTNNSETIF